MKTNYLENKVGEIKVAYIGGGSNNWARVLMNDLAKEKSLSGEINLYDIDFEAAKRNEVIGNKVSCLAESESLWKYSAKKNISEALKGVDFVFISILPGSFDDMAVDVHAPEEYGIIQSVGDSTGLGGATRAWRTIPQYVEIARNIEKYCPEAWVFNFTNPMSICVDTLYEVFPGIKAFGCCHEVFGTQKLLKKAIEELTSHRGVDYREIKTNVVGINHFTWITEATYKDLDLFPYYRNFVEKYGKNGIEESENHWMNDHFSSADLIKFDLFKRYEAIAAAGDRHLVEFVPNSWYLTRNEEWKFGLTPVSWRKENREKLVSEAKEIAAGEKEVEIIDSGEDFVTQLRALVGLEDLVTNVNLPNKGQVGNLPLGSVVETNALFSKNSVKPVISGDLPYAVKNMTLTHVENQKEIVKATLSEDREGLFRAFLNDPQAMNLSLEEGRKLFDKMLPQKK